MIGIAAMIGGAIFVLTGPAIGLAGSAVIVAFILNAAITIFTAMAYAELGSAIPEAGGGYLWVREGLPRPNAFMSGWLAWFAHSVAGSLYAVGFGSFVYGLLKMMNILGDQALFGFIPVDKLIAIASIVAFTYINIKGTSETGKTGTIVTVIQLGTIAALIAAGFWTMYTHPNWTANFSDFLPMGIGGLVAAMGLTFIAFEGYEVIVQTGEEVKNPRKNIPRAIFIALAIVVTLYCLVAFVSIGSIFPEGIPAWQFIGQNGELGIMKAAEMFMPYGVFVVLGGGIVSTLAALNATTFSSARVAFAMGRHYNLPHIFGSIHKKNKTPHFAIMLSGILMAIMAYVLPLNDIAIAAGVIFLLLFIQVNVAVITIRRMYGNKLNYGFKTPFFPIIPIIGIFLKLGLALYLLFTQPLSWAIAVIWIVLGFALYRIYTFKREIEHYAPIVGTEGDLVRKEFRILIPYTPDNPDRLLRYAIRFAKENDGEVNILRVITVPHQTPLSAGIAFGESAKKAFEPLDEILDKERVLNHYLVRVSHDYTEAVLATIEEQKIDLLVTDYGALRADKKLRTLATCDMLAIHATGGQRDDAILSASSGKKQQPKMNLVVVYDGGSHSDVVLKATTWLEHSGLFRLSILAITDKEKLLKMEEHEKVDIDAAHQGGHDDIRKQFEKEQFLENIGVEYERIIVNEEGEKHPEKFARLIQAAVDVARPHIVVIGASIGKFNVFDNPHFVDLIDRFNCPVIVARDFTIPGVNKLKNVMMRLAGK